MLILAKYYYNKQIKESEMDRKCSTNDTQYKCIQNCVRKGEGNRSLGEPANRREENISIDLKELWREVMDWIHLAHDWILRRISVNTLLGVQFHKRRGIFSPAELLLASQGGL